MDAKQFLAEFGHIVNAPDGIKRVRELVLSLAIQGDLTIRGTIFETADELFEKNQADKNSRIKHGIIPRQKTIPKINKNEPPWVLPSTWRWCRLGEITSYGITDKAEYDDVDKDTWVLELEDVEKETSKVLKKVRAIERKFRSSKNRFSVNSVLYGKLRPYLDKVVLADEDGVCTTEIMPINAFEGVLPEYLRWYLKSPYFINYANNSTHGMNLPRMGTEPGKLALFALPPMEEQKRIVAKVDELMALCDKLEAQQQKRHKLQTLTRTTALDALANAQSPHELKDAWLRVQGNMPFFFSDPNDVSNLKNMILALASIGSLDNHKDHDSNVLELFNSIKDIQNREFSNREKKELKSLKNPEQLDGNYLRVALGHVIKVVSGQHLKPTEYNDKKIGIPYITGPAEFGSKHPLPTKWTEERRAVATIGDILITVKGSGVGKTSLCDIEELAISRQLMAIRAIGQINQDYLEICVNAAKAKFQEQKMGIAIPGIGREDVMGLEIVLPCIEEQKRIVSKVKQLLIICGQLEKQLLKSKIMAKNLSLAAVAAITGTEITKEEEMKVPKTELVSTLKLKVSPTNKDQAPLSAILAKHNGELSSKALWNYSGLEIDAFYRQLKTEMARDWIVEPQKARVVEKDAEKSNEAEAS